jgi:uncharacterized protein YciW
MGSSCYTKNAGWYHETQSSRDQNGLCTQHEHEVTEANFLLDLSPIIRHLSSTQHTSSQLLDLCQMSYIAFFSTTAAPQHRHALTPYERLSSALTVAQVCGFQPLCSHYAKRLAPLNCPDPSRESNLRQTLITEYSRLLATHPSLVGSTTLQQLSVIGFRPNDIVLLTQLVGFVSFQARFLALLSALDQQPVVLLPGFPLAEDRHIHGFSLLPQYWHGYLDGKIHLHDAPHYLPEDEGLLPNTLRQHLAEDQSSSLSFQAFIDYFASSSTVSDDALLLLSQLYTARLNGCHYSASLFARRYLAKTADNLTIEQLFDPQLGEHSPTVNHANTHSQQLLKSIRLLTRSPERFTPQTVQLLLESEIALPQSIDLLIQCAFLCWYHRLINALGSSSSAQ